MTSTDRVHPEPAADPRLTTQAGRFSARLGTRASAEALRNKVLAKESELFALTVSRLQQDPALIAAANLLVGARRRFVAGDGKSRAFAALLAADLAAGMANVYQIDNNAVQTMDVLADVRSSDTLVSFSFRRYRRSSMALAELFKKEGGNLIVVTDDLEAPLASLTDIVIAVSTESESYANSQTAIALVCHLLSTLTVASAKGAKRRLTARDRIAQTIDLYLE